MIHNVCMYECMYAGAVEEEEEDEGDQIQEQVDHEGGGGHGSPADMEEICHQGSTVCHPNILTYVCMYVCRIRIYLGRFNSI